MIKETQEYINNGEHGSNAHADLAISVLAIGQGLYHAEQNNEGLTAAASEAKRVVLTNIPACSQALDRASLIRLMSKSPKEQHEVTLASIESLQMQEAVDSNTRLQKFMQVIAASSSLANLKRLERHLRIRVPRTEKSFRVLSDIAAKNKRLFDTDKDSSRQNLDQAVTLLLTMDKHVIETVCQQAEEINKLRDALEKRCKPTVETLVRDGAVEIEEVKRTIIDEIIYELRRKIGQVDSIKRPVSQYEVRVNSIIDDENLAAQNDQANQLTAEKQADYKKNILPGIARKRAEKRILQTIRIALLLRQKINATQDNAGKNQLISGGEIAKQADKYIKKHKYGDLVEEEKRRLEEQIDMLRSGRTTLSEEEYEALTHTTFSEKEYSILKPLIEKKSQKETVYKLGEARLQEKIADEISEEDIKAALLKKLTNNAIRNFMETTVSEVIDQAVGIFETNGQSIFSNPEVLSKNKDTIVANAVLILKTKIDNVDENNVPTNDIHNRKGDVIVLFRRKGEQHTKEARENEINDSNIDISGLDWTPILEALVGNPAIGKVEFHNLSRLKRGVGETLRLAVEYCPLYKPGKLHESSLAETAQGIDGIVSSRVGRKWIATQAALQTLNNFLKANGRGLEVKVTFADWAVLAGKEAATSEEALRQHGKLYREQVSQLYKQIGIPYSFQLMSDVLAHALKKLGIGQFVVAENSSILQNISENPDIILRRLGFEQNDIGLTDQRQRAKIRNVLKDLLTSCEGNIALVKGLVGAYYMNLPILLQDCDMHLGMERSKNLLDISTLAQNEKAVINVLVK